MGDYSTMATSGSGSMAPAAAEEDSFLSQRLAFGNDKVGLHHELLAAQEQQQQQHKRCISTTSMDDSSSSSWAIKICHDDNGNDNADEGDEDDILEPSSRSGGRRQRRRMSSRAGGRRRRRRHCHDDDEEEEAPNNTGSSMRVLIRLLNHSKIYLLAQLSICNLQHSIPVDTVLCPLLKAATNLKELEIMDVMMVGIVLPAELSSLPSSCCCQNLEKLSLKSCGPAEDVFLRFLLFHMKKSQKLKELSLQEMLLDSSQTNLDSLLRDLTSSLEKLEIESVPGFYHNSSTDTINNLLLHNQLMPLSRRLSELHLRDPIIVSPPPTTIQQVVYQQEHAGGDGGGIQRSLSLQQQQGQQQCCSSSSSSSYLSSLSLVLLFRQDDWTTATTQQQQQQQGIIGQLVASLMLQFKESLKHLSIKVILDRQNDHPHHSTTRATTRISSGTGVSGGGESHLLKMLAESLRYNNQLESLEIWFDDDHDNGRCIEEIINNSNNDHPQQNQQQVVLPQQQDTAVGLLESVLANHNTSLSNLSIGWSPSSSSSSSNSSSTRVLHHSHHAFVSSPTVDFYLGLNRAGRKKWFQLEEEEKLHYSNSSSKGNICFPQMLDVLVDACSSTTTNDNIFFPGNDAHQLSMIHYILFNHPNILNASTLL